MNKLLAGLDSLKATLLLSIVAAAGLGIWNLVLDGKLDDSLRAWRNAQNDVREIFALLKQIQPLYAARRDQGAVDADPGVYFEKQLTEYGGIPLNQYTLKGPEEREVTAGPGKKATEYKMTIDFARRGRGQRLFLPRKNLFTALYNCEANSKRWKLRELKIRAREDVERRGGRDSGYPPELSDEWYVERLVFASREPRAK